MVTEKMGYHFLRGCCPFFHRLSGIKGFITFHQCSTAEIFLAPLIQFHIQINLKMSYLSVCQRMSGKAFTDLVLLWLVMMERLHHVTTWKCVPKFYNSIISFKCHYYPFEFDIKCCSLGNCGGLHHLFRGLNNNIITHSKVSQSRLRKSHIKVLQYCRGQE